LIMPFKSQTTRRRNTGTSNTDLVTISTVELPSNVYTATACLLWSGNPNPDDHPRFPLSDFESMKQNAVIAAVTSLCLQTLCLCAMTYFVLHSEARQPHATDWIIHIPSANRAPIFFFCCFVTTGCIVVQKEMSASVLCVRAIFDAFYIKQEQCTQTEALFFLLCLFPWWLAEIGGYLYLMAFATRFNAAGDSNDFLEYVLNLLAFEFVFSIDDWIFEIMSPRWVASGVWKSEFLTVRCLVYEPYDRIRCVESWHLYYIVIHIGFCVCSRIALCIQTAVSILEFARQFESARSKHNPILVNPITALWLPYMLLWGGYVVFGGDDTIFPSICYALGSVLLICWVPFVIYWNRMRTKLIRGITQGIDRGNE